MQTNNHLRVEGNTDNIRMAQPRSTRRTGNCRPPRATGVTRYLVEEKGLSPLRVSLAGYGEYRPRADNRVPADRRLNRHVDIVILNSAMSKADAAVQP